MSGDEVGAGAAEAPPPGTRAARRRERTRLELIDAARKVIAERGVAALRVVDLAEAVDVARGSFYTHFDSVEDLVAAVVGETLESLGRQAEEAQAGHEDPVVAASASDRRAIRLAYDAPEFARLMVNLDRSDDVFARALAPHARAVLERGIAAGCFRVPDVDVAVIMLTGGAIALIRAILDGTAPPDADVAHAEAVLLSYGIAPAEAARISRLPLD